MALNRTILLLLAALFVAGPADARRRKNAPPRPKQLLSHTYDREIHSRHHLTRAERRRFRWGGMQDRRIDPVATGTQLERLVGQNTDTLKLSVIGHAGAQRLPLYRVDVKGDGRGAGQGRRRLRVLVAAGLHGDEPTGVHTALRFLKRITRDAGLRERFEITVLPMVNPTGLAALTRVNGDGKDVNRSFAPGKWTPESRAVARSLGNERYDLFIDLHGANKPGYFLFRAANDGKLSGRILSAMHSEALLDVNRNNKPGNRYAARYWLHGLGAVESSHVGPWERKQLRGQPAPIASDFEKFMYDHGARHSFTLEYPRRLASKQQVQGMMKLLRSTLYNVERHGVFGKR